MFWLILLIFLCIGAFASGEDNVGVAIIGLFIIVVILVVRDKKKNKEKAMREQAEIVAKTPIYNAARSELLLKYGEPTRTIKLNELDLGREIIIFEQVNRVWLCGRDLSMNDILSCSFTDEPRVVKGKVIHRTKTDNLNMIIRSEIGDTFGEKGAVMGGLTANKKTISTQEPDTIHHNYTVVVNINSLSDPIVRIKIGEDGKTVNEIIALVNVMLSRKKR